MRWTTQHSVAICIIFAFAILYRELYLMRIALTHHHPQIPTTDKHVSIPGLSRIDLEQSPKPRVAPERSLDFEIDRSREASKINYKKDKRQTGDYFESNSKPNVHQQSKFSEPVVDPSWILLPDDHVKQVSRLPGEGLLNDEIASLPRKGRGVLFNAIHREPQAQRISKQIPEVAASAKRMQEVLQEAGLAEQYGFVLFTERAPWEFMNDPVRCRAHLWPECEEFMQNRDCFMKVFFYDDYNIPAVIERRERFQTWPKLWLMRILATLNSPFEETLVVDSDVYACTNFEQLFDTFLGDNHLAITLAPAPFGSSRNFKGAFREGFPQRYEEFPERNLGLQVLRTGDQHVLQLIALFRDVYIRQVNDTAHVSIGNDQSAFREALFTMNNDIKEIIIPSDVGCRHEAGCADGCLVVHRHHRPELSGKDYMEWKRKQNERQKQQRQDQQKQNQK